MKKTFLILIIISIASVSWSQSLSTVRGRTKEGKTFQVTYYHGASEDYIESVKYQLIDELQAKVTKLQGENKELQNKLDAANKRLKEVNDNANQSTNEQIVRLQDQLEEKEVQILLLNQELDQLRIQFDSLSSIAIADQQDMQQKINEKDQRIAELSGLAKRAPKPAVSPIIGLEGGFGQVIPNGSINENWNEKDQISMQFDVFFRTPRLFKAFPMAVEAGVGLHYFGLSAETKAHSLNIEATDYDGFTYNALYNYTDLKENLTLAYLNIPIQLYIGQTIRDQVTVYAKIGVTPSINLISDYEGTGTYSIKGYYPQWGALLEDMEELGFVSGQDYGEEAKPSINKFILWSNVAIGASMPFGRTPLQLNAGMKLDYSLMSIGKAEESDTMSEGRGLLPNGGQVLVPNINLGLIYLLK